MKWIGISKKKIYLFWVISFNNNTIHMFTALSINAYLLKTRS